MILLDTHALLWWVSDSSQLSARARRITGREAAHRGGLLVSSISAWEIAMLVSRSRLHLTLTVEDWISRVERIDAIRFIPVTNKIALASVALTGSLHQDPADRIIVATAKETGCSLVTRDEKLHAYPHVETVW